MKRLSLIIPIVTLVLVMSAAGCGLMKDGGKAYSTADETSVKTFVDGSTATPDGNKLQAGDAIDIVKAHLASIPDRTKPRTMVTFAENEKGWEEKTYTSTRSCLELIHQAYPYLEFKEKSTGNGLWLVWSEPDLLQSSYSVNERTLVVKSVKHPKAISGHPEVRDSCLYN